jgi:MoaA/NifB/PqqE/SkfB family radical SAM enzyme
MKTRVIGFLINLKCNAACKHCCFSSGPDRTDAMSRSEALSYVRQVAEVEGLKGISITGGEAFLAYPLLVEMTAELAKHNLRARAVSNCFWAKTPRIATRRLRPLFDNGLTELSVSYDAVHEEFVQAERVQFAVKAALDLGMKVVVSTVVLNGSISEHTERIKKELNLPRHDRLFIMPGYIVPNGRAAHYFPLNSLALVNGYDRSGGRLRSPCPHVIREPIVTPGGDVAACCRPSSATRVGFDHHFIVGNLRQQHLSDIVAALDDEPIFNTIMMEGPWRLFDLVEREDPTVMKRKTFVNICDLCQSVLRNEKAQEIIRAHEPQLRVQSFVEKMVAETTANGDPDEVALREQRLVQMRPYK